MVSHLLLPMHVTKALGQTIILLVRVVWEESGTTLLLLIIYSDSNIGSLSAVGEIHLVFFINVFHICFLYSPSHTHLSGCTSQLPQPSNNIMWYLQPSSQLTVIHLCAFVNLAQQLQSKATVLLVLTHLISSTFSTFGSIMLEGRVLDCKSTSRSSSARPLDTEFILTHFSAWPKSNSSRIFTMVSLASLYNIYKFRCTRKEKESIFSIDQKRHWEENLLKWHREKARQPV